ncbi:MAG: Sensor histidine kinase RcsC [Anaerolineae bacterium]|nr:Sensor histidine kinase RcsC [Anaerolineae bacterium]
MAHILVVDDDLIGTKTMSLLLSRLDHQVTTHNDPAIALKWLQVPGNLPDLVISDVTMPGMSGYEFVSQIRSAPITAHLPIIMLTAMNEIDSKVEGFKAGADDYLTKPVDRTELEWRIKALLARAEKAKPQQEQREAKLISVFSLRGGVGTTTVAVNMAIALAHLWNKEIPLLDLALTTGHCAMFLNLNPKHTVSSIVGWDSATMDAETIERLLIKHKTGVRLLAAPRLPTEAELIDASVIDHIWPYLRASFPFIVADAGSNFTEPALTVLERSQAILLLLAPELGSLKAAVDAIKVFKELGFDRHKILPVLNETFSGDGISHKHMEDTIKQEFEAIIPYNRTAFVQAINTGQPHVLSNHNSPASRAISALAYKLSATEMEADHIESPSPLLSWARKLMVAA